MMWGGSLLVLLLVVVLVWFLVRGGQTPSAKEQSPEDILKQRYARGEIETDEYERRLKELRK